VTAPERLAPLICEICGDPLRPDNTFGICNNKGQPECVRARQRIARQRKPPKPPAIRPEPRRCELCGKPLRANNQSGLCSGTDSPACKTERSRRLNERKASEVKADPRADAPRCDVCGGKLNRNNTMGVCGDPWKPECRRERKRRKAAGVIPGPKGPAIIAGDVFGRWTALETSRIETAFVLCRCECGNERSVLGRNLVLRISRDCGCKYRLEGARKRFPGPYLRAGEVFGRLTVLEDVWRAHDGARCLCECEGGTEVSVANPERLKNGRTKSCGCLRREGQTTHGFSKHPLYGTWYGMIDRCTNPKNPNYPNYGGRGLKAVKVCERWRDPWLFAEDIERECGPRPPGKYLSGVPLYTLDRIDVDGDYEPGNVRWLDQSGQVRNQRTVGQLTRERDDLAAEVERLKGLLGNQ
jgi:hypothetical protein